MGPKPLRSILTRNVNVAVRLTIALTCPMLVAANNETLAPYYEIDEKFFDQKIRELVLRYNYTLNPIGVYEAINYMYTYWPDPKNTTHIREEYINVSRLWLSPRSALLLLNLFTKYVLYFWGANRITKTNKKRTYQLQLFRSVMSGAPS